MKQLIYILLFLGSNSLSLQIDNDAITPFNPRKHKFIYNLTVNGFPQSIELIKFRNGNASITIKTFFWRRVNWRRSTYVSKLQCDKGLAQKIIAELERLEMESVDCKYDNRDCITSLGEWVTWTIHSTKVKRQFIWDIHYKETISEETPENRRRGVEIMKYLDQQIDFEKTFAKIRQLLPKGKYSYAYGHATIASFERK